MAVNMIKLKVFAGRFVGDSHSDTKFSENRAIGWRKRRQLFGLRQRVIVAAALACTLFASSPSYSMTASNYDDPVVLELSALGKQGDTIARAREQVLDILQQGNACTAWFQGADPDPAEVIRSLHFALEMKGPSYVYGNSDSHGGQVFKHPWAARSMEYGGRASTILLNANGPFFNRISVVMQLDPRGMPPRPDGNRLLRVSSYEGNTPEAQITILLHELGHIIGRLPEDADSLDGRSSRNTSEVLRHCKTETRAGRTQLAEAPSKRNRGVQPGNGSRQGRDNGPGSDGNRLLLNPKESFVGHHECIPLHVNSRNSI